MVFDDVLDDGVIGADGEGEGEGEGDEGGPHDS